MQAGYSGTPRLGKGHAGPDCVFGNLYRGGKEGAPGANRTRNLGLRSALLCPFELLGPEADYIPLWIGVAALQPVSPPWPRYASPGVPRHLNLHLTCSLS